MNGIIDLTVDILDDGDDPREIVSHKFKIEIKYILVPEEPVVEEVISDDEEVIVEIDTSGMSEEEIEEAIADAAAEAAAAEAEAAAVEQLAAATAEVLGDPAVAALFPIVSGEST
jgi:regulator of protease activity HflC (stomatin/prohibitin superfamily)